MLEYRYLLLILFIYTIYGELFHEHSRQILPLNIHKRNIAQIDSIFNNVNLVKRDTHISEHSKKLCSHTVNSSSIIRTNESLANGAVYLQDFSKLTRSECLRRCCENSSCTVAVYENKDNRECYLFNCGYPNRCRFSPYGHYDIILLSNFSKFHHKSHEDELSLLNHVTQKKIPKTSPAPVTLLKQPVSLFGDCHSGDVCRDQYALCVQGSCMCQNGYQVKYGKCRQVCRRYHFECENAGGLEGPECIDFALACDGVPQCADGSDERSCPTSGLVVKAGKNSLSGLIHHQGVNKISPVAANKNPHRVPQQVPSYGRDGLPYSAKAKAEYSKYKVLSKETNNPKIKLKSMVQRNRNELPSTTPARASTTTHVKVAEKVKPVERLQKVNYRGQPSANNILINPYTKYRYQAQYPQYDWTDYSDYGSNPYPDHGSSYRGRPSGRVEPGYDYNLYINPYNQPYIGSDPKLKKGKVSQTSGKDHVIHVTKQRKNNKQRVTESKIDTQGNSVHTINNKQTVEGQVTHHRSRPSVTHRNHSRSQTNHENISPTISSRKFKPAPHHTKNKTLSSHDSESETTDVVHGSILTNQSKPTSSVSDDSSLSGNKLHKSSGDLSISKKKLKKTGGWTLTPIVALALGLIITLVLLVLVACRLRNVKRRIRKGRPLNSHEADYLINGMYL